jgi:hypothetical protein
VQFHRLNGDHDGLHHLVAFDNPRKFFFTALAFCGFNLFFRHYLASAPAAMPAACAPLAFCICCTAFIAAAFTLRKYSWYSFLLEAESTPGP